MESKEHAHSRLSSKSLCLTILNDQTFKLAIWTNVFHIFHSISQSNLKGVATVAMHAAELQIGYKFTMVLIYVDYCMIRTSRR